MQIIAKKNPQHEQKKCTKLIAISYAFGFLFLTCAISGYIYLPLFKQKNIIKLDERKKNGFPMHK